MYSPLMEQTVADPELTNLDRCDRCGAQALHRHKFKTGELLFCGHHDAEHSDKMIEVEIS